MYGCLAPALCYSLYNYCPIHIYVDGVMSPVMFILMYSIDITSTLTTVTLTNLFLQTPCQILKNYLSLNLHKCHLYKHFLSVFSPSSHPPCVCQVVDTC